LSEKGGCTRGMRASDRWMMIMLSEEKCLEKKGGGWRGSDILLCSRLSRQFPFFIMSQRKRNFSGEAHVRIQGRWKIYICTEK